MYTRDASMQTATQTSPQLVAPAAFASTVPGRVVLGVAATLVVALAAHVSIPLWFTPVPLTLQPLAVLGVGLALGPVTGFFAMLAYLLEGAAGLPVFSPTGLGGVAQLLGPTGGYLMAYPLVAAIAGGLTRVLAVRAPRFVAALVGCAAATVLLFACGAAWMAQLLHLSGHALWIESAAPFVPGEAIKVVVAAGVYSTLTRQRKAETSSLS
jgi:biotin transport system substrate-specific component